MKIKLENNKEKIISRITTITYRLSKNIGLIVSMSSDSSIIKEVSIKKGGKFKKERVTVSKGFQKYDDEGFEPEFLYALHNSLLYKVIIDLNNNTILINGHHLELGSKEFKLFLMLCRKCKNSLQDIPIYTKVEKLYYDENDDIERVYKRIQRVGKKLQKLFLHEDFLSLLVNSLFDEERFEDIRKIFIEHDFTFRLKKIEDFYKNNNQEYDDSIIKTTSELLNIKRNKNAQKEIEKMYYGHIDKIKKEIKNIKIDIYYVLGIGFLWCGVVNPDKLNKFTQNIIDVVKLHNIEKILSGERNKGYRLLLLPDSIDIKEPTISE